jgi:uncharacterized protein YdhG (YjbR/CyaY superfamily)
MKTNKTIPKDIDEYIASFPKDIQEILEKLRTTIRKAAPDAEEIINYQIPTFTLKGNLVHFAAFKKHIGFYPTPKGIEVFKKELSAYEGAKGSVKFPLDKPIPFDLISKIVTYRVKENLERAEAKMKKKKQKRCLWPYSSAKIHCGISQDDPLGVNQLFDYMEKEPKERKEFIEAPDNPDEIKEIREKTRAGRPLGPNDFIEKLEGQLKRLFKLKPKGRTNKIKI